MIKETFWYTVSSVCVQGAKFVAYIYAAKQLGPKTYGLWNGLLLILTYGMNSHLGVLNAMNRDVPYFMGAGKPERAAEIRNLGAGVVVYSALPLASIVFLSSFYPGLGQETAAGLRFVSVILVFQQIYLFYQMVLKSHGLFGMMSVQQVYYSSMMLVVVVALTKYYGFNGFMTGQILIGAAILFYLFKRVPIKFKPIFSVDKALGLAKVGFPIMTVGLAYGMLITVDRVMILRFLGAEQLGYYSMSIMATGALTLLPLTVSEVLYPKMARKYGMTKDKASLKDLVYRPTLHLMWIMGAVLFIVYFTLPEVINFFLPEYSKGIPAMKITIWGVYFLSLVGAFACFLNTVNLQKIYLAVQVFTIMLIVVLNMAFIKAGMGIRGVALATAMTYMVYAAALFSVTQYAIKKANRGGENP